MKITILGAGAIGSLWAVALQPQHDVQVWTRSSITRYPLTFQSLNGEVGSYCFNANHADHLQQSDVLLVTVKSFQVITALQPLVNDLSARCKIVIMHNGIGSHDTVKQLFPKHTICYATTSHAALKTAESTLRHTGLGQTFIGAISSAISDGSSTADILNQALSPCYWQDDIMEPLWKKLAINCAINPLTAIHQCTNGELANEDYQDQLIQICNEVTLVMRAEGYSVKNGELYQQALTVINATADNYSSMNRDIFYQRQTEIDYITGYLIHRAKKFDIAVPVNTQLWQTITSMESSYHARTNNDCSSRCCLPCSW
ncbi:MULTISPECIES: 2-dehydropantoate 2-reductase [unclassified Photobacterium]|uniref:2-dehydropantoate 2-reductase n=1 Tax=unclassified Photobacterium TaxID=2628852 RepID=UPI001EE08338